MITNFEEYTHELNETEKKVIKPLIDILFNNHIGRNNSIYSPALVDKLYTKTGIVIEEPRLRKLINFISRHSILPVIGTSLGYYVSYNQKEIEKQIQSLQDRADSQLARIDGLRCFLQAADQINLPL